MARMTFEAFRKNLFSQAKEKGFTDYELYYSGGNAFSIRVFGGEIQEYKDTNTEGVGFRGTFGNKMGYAYTENLDSDVIPQLLENAMGNATIIEDEEVEKLYPGDDKYEEINSYNPALNDVETAQKIEWAMEMEKYAKSLDPRVKMADFCIVANFENSMTIANSYGLNLSQKSNMAQAVVLARVEENGQNKNALEIWMGRDFADFDYKKLAEKAVNNALSYLGASSIPSGQYPIILNQDTARDILGVFHSVFVAERCQKGFSLLNKGKLGETIAASHVTLRDDAITEHSLLNLAFDAEGVATGNKAVVENGILKTLLYNTKSAEKDGVKSTGNATKQSFGAAISTGPTNFYIAPGETSYDDMVARLKKGVIVTNMAGLHSGVNPISGDFSVSADGYYVEDGKIVKPVEQITVAGNFYELLKNIETVGSDLKIRVIGMSGLGAPSILVNGLSIAGSQ